MKENTKKIKSIGFENTILFEIEDDERLTIMDIVAELAKDIENGNVNFDRLVFFSYQVGKIKLRISINTDYDKKLIMSVKIVK